MSDPTKSLKLFAVYQDSKHKLQAVLIVPEDVSQAQVTAAWAFAVMYSAKGLTIPDYEAAVVLLQKRHPSWQVIGYEFIPIKLDLAKANDDISEET